MRTVARALFAVLSCCAASALAQGVAFITDLKGSVSVDGNTRVLVLSELAKGQRIVVDKDAAASVMYIASGKEYSLKGPGEFVVKQAELATSSGGALSARSTEWRASNKVLAQVAKTSSASVRMRSLAPAKVDRTPRLVFPVEGNVATLQPTFRWVAADPAVESQLTLLVAGQEKPVHRAKPKGDSYPLATRLKPGTEYVWVVAVGGNEIGTGRFRTLPADAIQLVEKRKPSERADFSDRVLHAMLLQEMGATQEARESWSRLAQERTDLPELSALAK